MKKAGRLFVFALSGLFIFFSSCNKESTQFEITVVDKNETPVSMATVTLYESISDWNEEANSLKTSLTNNNGIVTFTSLSPLQYYYDIVKDSLNNWETSNTLENMLTENSLNRTTIDINENCSWYLSGAAGKKWQIFKITRNNTDYTDSTQYEDELQNIYTYYKSTKFEMGITGSDTIFNEAMWKMDYMIDSLINITYFSGGSPSKIKIDSLSSIYMKTHNLDSDIYFEYTTINKK